MKNFILIILIFLLSECSNKLTYRHYAGEIPREDLDMKAFNEFVRQNLRPKNGKYSYVINRKNKVIHYNGDSTQRSFDFTIEDRLGRKWFIVRVNNGLIYSVSRIFNRKNDSLRIDNSIYYANGILASEYSVSETSLVSKEVYSNPKISVGRFCKFDKEGNLTYLLDYDKEFSMKLKNVVNDFKSKTRESVVQLTKIYFTDNDLDKWTVSKARYNYRLKYPYYEIIAKKPDKFNQYLYILDGKTGEILFKNGYEIRVSE